jgi:hypothetical protein
LDGQDSYENQETVGHPSRIDVAVTARDAALGFGSLEISTVCASSE